MIKSQPLRASLIVGVLTILSTAVIALMGLEDKFVSSTYEKSVFRWLAEVMVGATVALACLALIDEIEKYKKERTEAESARHNAKEAQARLEQAQAAARAREASVQAIPEYVRVIERTDHLLIEENGDATLEWSFEVSNLEGSKDLELQIYSEHQAHHSSRDTIPPSNVEVTELRVAGHVPGQPSDFYTLKEMRYPVNGGGAVNPMEFGILKVPITLADVRNQRAVPVRMKMKLKQTFFHALGGDYFVVEVPQLTNKIRVTLASKDPKYRVVVPPSLDRIRARMGHSGTEDLTETQRQGAHVVQDEREIVWTAEYPKLGYQYLLNFQLIPVK